MDVLIEINTLCNYIYYIDNTLGLYTFKHTWNIPTHFIIKPFYQCHAADKIYYLVHVYLFIIYIYLFIYYLFIIYIYVFIYLFIMYLFVIVDL